MAFVESQIIVGNMVVKLAELEAESVDSCVTDPPYHLTSIVKRFGKTALSDNTQTSDRVRKGADGYARSARGFMGQTWDGGDLAFQPETWEAVLRVLKPGGYLLAFAAPKNAHRMFCAVEDAGFEIRDCIMWLYGSGFPKSHNLDGDWRGWGSALKPAYEPIVVARKPLVGTIAQNVEAHGVGAINIDASRVAIDPALDDPRLGGKGDWSTDKMAKNDYGDFAGDRVASSPLGRWPANVIHDGSDEVLAAFPEAPGQLADASSSSDSRKTQNVYGAMQRGSGGSRVRLDSGSAARFFYCAKASKSDRNEGTDDLPKKPGGMISETSGQHVTRRDGYEPPKVGNHHPTVKPTALMRYLCRLVTPPDGLVLDPFMGSGSTGKAAAIEGFRFVGVELDPEYATIAQHRIWHAQGLGWLA